MNKYKYHARKSIDPPAWHTVYAFFLDPSLNDSESINAYSDFTFYLREHVLRKDTWENYKTLQQHLALKVQSGKWTVVMHCDMSAIKTMSEEEFNEIYVKG